MKKLFLICLGLLVGLLVYQQVKKKGFDPPPGPSSVRIVSLAPTLTEILFELGVGGRIVGVTTYCVYPPDAQKKEKIGDFINPNTEKIINLKPGVVFAERWSSTKIVARLRSMGLNVVEVPSPHSLDEIYQVIRQVGQAVKKEDRAQEIEVSMRKRIEAIRLRAQKFHPRPSLYVEIDLPTWTIGRPSYTNEAVSLCGARNIFEDVERSALQASKEAIIQRDPDVILSFVATAAQLRQRPGWQAIAAVKGNRIIDDFNPELLVHGNHRLVQGMEELQKRLEGLRTH